MSIEFHVSARIGRGSAAENKSWNRKPWPPPHQSNPNHSHCQACQVLPSTQSVSCRSAHHTKHLSPLAAHHRSQSTHRKTPSLHRSKSPSRLEITLSFSHCNHTTNSQVCLQRTRLMLHDIVLPPRLRILFSSCHALPCRMADCICLRILDPQRFSWGASTR
jgi:hypothetical protein